MFMTVYLIKEYWRIIIADMRLAPVSHEPISAIINLIDTTLALGAIQLGLRDLLLF